MSDAAIPMPVAVPWIAEDLDIDGELELVVQRGDELNGYLDIFSSSTWLLRQRFTFPGRRGLMHPRLINVDLDPYLELFATLNDGFGGPAQAVLIDYSPLADTFLVKSLVDIPINFGGPPGIADFDHDGKLEFVAGGLDGYGLLELQGDQLVYLGFVDPTPGNNNAAAAFRPYPGGTTRLALSHAMNDTYRLDVLESTGDNQFSIEQSFVEITGWTSYSRVVCADVDCDSMDEIVSTFLPRWIEWGWDPTLMAFDSVCVWHHSDFPVSLFQWYALDLTHDGRPEWCAVSYDSLLYVFPDPSCASCDSLGNCPGSASLCYCPCVSDPNCDGVRVDLVDVVECIGVAFRGNLSTADQSCFFDRADLNCDGAINVVDVVKIVGVAFRGESSSVEFCQPCP